MSYIEAYSLNVDHYIAPMFQSFSKPMEMIQNHLNNYHLEPTQHLTP
jgi:hypothetical protein